MTWRPPRVRDGACRCRASRDSTRRAKRCSSMRDNCWRNCPRHGHALSDIGRGLAAVESASHADQLLDAARQRGARWRSRNSFAGALVKAHSGLQRRSERHPHAVRNDVMKETQRKQCWSTALAAASASIRPRRLLPAPAPPTAPKRPSAPRASATPAASHLSEAEACRTKDTTNPAVLEAFIARYKDTFYELARGRLKGEEAASSSTRINHERRQILSWEEGAFAPALIDQTLGKVLPSPLPAHPLPRSRQRSQARSPLNRNCSRPRPHDRRQRRKSMARLPVRIRPGWHPWSTRTRDASSGFRKTARKPLKVLRGPRATMQRRWMRSAR